MQGAIIKSYWAEQKGIDPKDIAGYSLVDPLADFSKITKQGINGPIWALMALDSCGYNFSSQAIVNAGNSLTTKEKLIDLLLRQQKTDGGWAVSRRSRCVLQLLGAIPIRRFHPGHRISD